MVAVYLWTYASSVLAHAVFLGLPVSAVVGLWFRFGLALFPWLVSGENDRPFCQAATERGILLAPGDCFDAPSHFRLGFAAAGDNADPNNNGIPNLLEYALHGDPVGSSTGSTMLPQTSPSSL